MTPDALTRARTLIDRGGLDAFSFDIFDTFLLRRCTAPDGVYERAYALAPFPVGRRVQVESFVQHRQVAEYKARIGKLRATGKPETSIDEIYQQFPIALFGLESADRAKLAAAEFQAERELCLLNRDIFDLYQAARAAGLKTGFLSDTYWSREQLEILLQGVAPGLEIDFLYASSEIGVGKSHGLFKPFLADGAFDPDRVCHIGDNPAADVTAAEARGITPVHYPQASEALAGFMQRERTILKMLQSQRGDISMRLDGGLSVLRRLSAARLPGKPQLHQLIGATVLGPVMVGFQRFVAARIAEIAKPGRTLKVMFLARDGFLPYQLWQRAGAGEASYVELNRRVALVGSTNTIEPLQSLFRAMVLINAESVDNFLKVGISEVQQFFREQPDEMSTGEKFAEAMPDLIGPEKMKELSQAIRNQVLTYMRAAVPGFDEATDYVIVDLGYSGTIQRAFRGLLDRAGLTQRLHGIYVSIVDENFATLPDGDSAVGFIDDSIVTPMTKRILLRNIALLEQFCCAPVGSVQSYDGGDVRREEEARPPKQVAFCAEIQRACLDFANVESTECAGFDIDPFADLERNRLWAAAILGRFLLLPRPDEQNLFGGLKQDVNLGSRTLIDMIDLPQTEAMLDVLPVPVAGQMTEPPAWVAGSLATSSPLAAYAYLLDGFGLMGGDLLADTGIGQVDVTVIKDDVAETIPVGCMMTAFGEVRLRIPILKRHTGSVVAIPLDRFMNSGTVRSLILQQGESGSRTMFSREIQSLPIDTMRTLRAHQEGGRFRRTGPDGHLLFDVPSSDQPLSILTLIVEPPSNAA